ncbi:MAG: type II toxin-antitoxin system RelE/ParE family toxin [Thermodesulfobacteriota bacterium]
MEEFLNLLPDEHTGKVLQVIQMLEERGPNLPFPYSSQVLGKLRELRAHYGRVKYRILYYGDVRGVFILLHAFRKQAAQIPEREKRLALQRLKNDEQIKKRGAS